MPKGGCLVFIPSSALRFFFDLYARNPIAAAKNVATTATVAVKKLGDERIPDVESIEVS
jgi:hypothetical protein